MKFSIITVCRNSEKTIENTVLSVINQSYKNYEYIIIDGASEDKTLDILNKYRDKITQITSEPDKGLYDAMNKGINISSGDYLFFLNSDDRLLHENILEIVSKKAENNQKELLYGDQVFVDKSTGQVSIRKHNKLNKIYLLKNTPCQPATFYKSEVFNKYGYFNTDYKIVSDQEWFFRVFLKHTISSFYVGFPITAFTTGEGLSTNDSVEEKLNTERDKLFKEYFSCPERKKLEFVSKYLRCLTLVPVLKSFLDQFFAFELKKY